MFPYWLLFGIFATGSVQYANPEAARRSGVLFAAAGIVVALMIGLRYHVGGDWLSYLLIYREAGTRTVVGALSYGDPGYTILNWVAHQLGQGIWLVNVVCGAIFTWALLRFAWLQPNPWLAVLVAVPYLIIVVAMGYSRQGVAIAFSIAALVANRDGRVLKTLFYLVCAVAFHKTAIILAPLIGLASVRNRLVTTVLVILTVPILYYAFVQASVDRLVTNYVEADLGSSGALVRIMMYLPAALIFLRYRDRLGFDPAERLIWRSYAVGVVVALLSLPVTTSTSVDRIALYLYPLQLAVLSRLPYAFPTRTGANKLIMLGLLVFCAAVEFTWLNYGEYATFWTPYQLYPVFDDKTMQDLPF